MHGKADAAATTVIVPAERAPAAVTPVISYQCAIDAVTSRCFPSYALRRHAHATGAVAQFEFLLVAACLAEGWAVSVPDHEGRLGMWGAPYEPGYHILDGSACRARLEAARPVARCADRPLGLFRRWTGQRMGRRDERLLRARTERRRRGARIACRRSRPHVPPTQRHLHVWAARARRRRTRRTSIPTSTGSSRSTSPKRARCCSSACTR